MSIVINTPCGPIRGVAGKQPGVVAFKGIRYATARRFEYPQVVTHWEGEYDATRYGDCCLQRRAVVPEASSPNPFYYNEFRKDEPFTYSEDCQVLNIFAPEQAEKAPVIVYIHGGAFMGGSGSEKPFQDPIWPTKGVIGVTINYRLNIFGYVSFEEQQKAEGRTGNFGLADQLAALQWVHDNIAAFGGDPDNITVMGQSAGAMSVQCIVCSPKAKGLVAKAVLSSGGGRGRMFGEQYATGDGFAFGRDAMEGAGVTDLDAFRALPSLQAMNSMGNAMQKNTVIKGLPTVPMADGVLLPKTPHAVMDAGEQLDIPYLIGSNTEDMEPVSMQVDVQEWVELQKQPAYGYLFGRQLPGDKAGAFHSSDLWYWFGTLDNSWRPNTEWDYKLSEIMVDYLLSFARTGHPGGENLPAWMPGSKDGCVMCLGDETVGMQRVVPEALAKTDQVKGW